MTLRSATTLGLLFAFSVFGLTASADEKSTRLSDVQHVPVYDVDGRFGGWPANHGIWSWGNEILVGFGAGYYKDLGTERHNIDRDKPEEHLLARSKDGGETWTISNPAEQGMLVGNKGMRHGAVPPGYKERQPVELKEAIDFTNPDFAMTCRMSDVDTGESKFYFSYDRGQTWQGPFKLPLFGQKGIAARTDYIVNGPHDCMLFLTASKSNNREGRVICTRTSDGGKTWNFVSYIGEEPNGYAIMPSSIRLSPTDLLSTIRCRAGRGEPNKSWIDAYVSKDDGKSWSIAKSPVADAGEGNPPSLVHLKDGRVCLTYGYRAKPFSMLARMSDDGGHNWGDPLVIRDDGAGRDIGYPRSVLRPDGKIVTIYYFFDASDPDRKIIASIWSPPGR